MSGKVEKSKISKRIKAFAVLHFVLLLYSIGGISSKLAAQKPFLSAEFVCLYGIVLLILVLYAFLWQQVLKELPLITAYANKAITVVWGLAWGTIIFGEQITPYKALGVFLIVAGIFLVVNSEGEKKDKEDGYT